MITDYQPCPEGKNYCGDSKVCLIDPLFPDKCAGKCTVSHISQYIMRLIGWLVAMSFYIGVEESLKNVTFNSKETLWCSG